MLKLSQLRLFGVIILYLLFNIYLIGQPYREHKVFLQRVNCIFYNEIYDINSDNYGYLYLATDKGTFYYDGEKLQPIYQKNHQNDFIEIYKSNDNQFFSLPFNGCLHKIIDENNIQKKKILQFDEYPNLRLITAYTDSHDTIHFAQNMSNSKHLDVKFKDDKIIVIDTIIDILDFYKNFLKDKNIELDSIKHFEFIRDINLPITLFALKIVDDKYIITQKRIYKCENGNINQIIDIEKYHLNGIIQKILIHNNKKYICLVGKDCGVFEFDNGKVTKILNDENATGLCFDINQNLWISTRFNGLYKINPLDLNGRIIDVFDNIHKIIQTNDHHYYSCDNLGNLFLYESNGYKKSKIINTINKLTIAPSLKIQENNIFFSNSDEVLFINKINNYNKKIKFHSDVKGNIIDYFEANNKSFLICNYHYNIYINNTKKTYDFETKIYSSYQLNKDSIYLGSLMGLYLFETNKNQVSKIILSGKYNNKKLERISTSNDEIFFYFENGILTKKIGEKDFKELPIKIDNNDIKTVLKYKDYTVVILKTAIKLYNQQNELIGYYNKDAQYLGDCYIDGFIYNNTLNVYDKQYLYTYNVDELKFYNNKIRIYISDIDNNNNRLEIINENSFNIQFNHETSFSIKLDIFNKFNSDKILYKYYRSDKPSSIENELSGNSINFNDVDPGSYRIEIISNGKLIKDIYFNVLPLWYQTIAFKIFSTVLFSLFIVLLSYLFYNHQLKIKREHLITENKIFELESTAKLNQLKPHFVFNALIPLQSYILKQNVEAGLHYLDKFSLLLRKMLNHSNIKQISIADEVAFLNQYINLRKEEASNSFNFEINSNINNDILIPNLMIQPLVENAINYGMRNSVNDKKLEINFEKLDHQTIITKIYDSGYGINDIEKMINKKNHSISIIKERLHIYSNILKNNKLGIEFIKYEKGFIVILYLPIIT